MSGSLLGELFGSIRRCRLIEAGVTLLEKVCQLGDVFGFQKVHTRPSLTDSVYDVWIRYKLSATSPELCLSTCNHIPLHEDNG